MRIPTGSTPPIPGLIKTPPENQGKIRVYGGWGNDTLTIDSSNQPVNTHPFGNLRKAQFSLNDQGRAQIEERDEDRTLGATANFLLGQMDQAVKQAGRAEPGGQEVQRIVKQEAFDPAKVLNGDGLVTASAREGGELSQGLAGASRAEVTTQPGRLSAEQLMPVTLTYETGDPARALLEGRTSERPADGSHLEVLSANLPGMHDTAHLTVAIDRDRNTMVVFEETTPGGAFEHNR